MEKTTELKLIKSELAELRDRLEVCSHCGGVFVRQEDSDKVCEMCVKEALESEGFAYAEREYVKV